jgi:hypothetical protein
VTLPLEFPVVVGANATLSVTVWFGVSVVPPLTPPALNPAPVVVTFEIVTFELPLFVRVTSNVIALPMLTLPKLRVVGLATSIWVTATPFPLRAIVSGEFGASLASETDPESLPVEPGEKTALNVLLWPAGSDRGTAIPLMLKPVPATVACDMATLALPVFDSLIVCELLFPKTTFPKLTVAELAESCG